MWLMSHSLIPNGRAPRIVMMIYESVETGSSSRYLDSQQFDVKVKQRGCGGRVSEWRNLHSAPNIPRSVELHVFNETEI